MVEQSQSVYRYQAVEIATGRIRTGEHRGGSPYEVRSSLRRIGLEVQELRALEPPRAAERRTGWTKPLIRLWQARQCRTHRIQRADVCDSLGTLINAGVPLEQALSSLAASTARPETERRMLRALRDHIREGHPLSDACSTHPGWFDPFDVAMIRAGEQAGDVTSSLASLSLFHQRAGALGQKMFLALIYPVILLVAGLAVIEFMSFTTLPQLIALITQARQSPPWLTVQLVAMGQALPYWWPVILGVLIAAWLALRSLVARVPLDSRLGTWIHANPWARLRKRTRVANIALALARLRKAGLPLTDAVLVVADTVGDAPLRALLRQAADALTRGEDLSQAIGRSPLLDPEFAQLLQLGERSGELTDMLERIAERYQRAAERSSERLAAVLGPLAILVLACLIALVVIASVLPLMQLGDLA